MAETAKAYPLAWPAGRPRARARTKSKFGERSVAEVYKLLAMELSRLRASYIVISTNVPLKANGEPYSNPGRMPDPGCAVYFRLQTKPYCLPCDRWESVEENMYAVAKHIEAMRGMERWGVGSVEQTFAGFKQLAAETGPSCWAVLGVLQTATLEQIQAAYRQKARAAHPDQGGSEAAMQRLNAARDQALAHLKGGVHA